jgi:hypothetical protein
VAKKVDDALQRLRNAEPRNRPGHLPVDVRITPVGDDSWRADFDVQLGLYLVSGEACMVGGRVSITKVVAELNTIDPDSFDPDAPPPPTPPGGITTTVLRGIPLGQLTESIRAEVMGQAEFDSLAPIFRRRARAGAPTRRHAAADVRARKVLGRGRRRLGDDHFRRVAEAALRHQHAGHAPLRRALAEEFERSENTIRDWLNRCRELGWLAPTGHGQRGVMPGRRLLDHQEGEPDGK